MDYLDSVEAENAVTTDDSQENVDVVESPANTKNSDTTEKKIQHQKKKFVRLPLNRVKYIMKLDPECQKVNPDSVYLITKATELFLEFLGKESAKHSLLGKRKTVQRRDVDAVIHDVPQLCFLEGALE